MRILITALALMSSFGAFSASALASDDMRVLPNVSLDTIAPVLRNRGLTPKTIEVGGTQSLVVQSDDLQIIMRPTVCRPECTGLLLYTLFQGTAPAGLVNAYNEDTPPTVAYTAQGNTVLSRYLIADHGITEGSFIVNLVVFDNTVTKWMNSTTTSRAMSVSADAAMPATNLGRESEDYLRALMDRPDLFSGNASGDF